MEKKILMAFLVSFLLLGMTSAIDITNCTDLQNIENDLTADYVLTNNIDCSDTVNWNGGQGFQPIGIVPATFTGTLDGQGYNITNLFINRSLANLGLFTVIHNGTVENLGIFDAHVEQDTYYIAGILAGWIEDTDTGIVRVDNVHTSGTVICEGDCGGLIGISVVSYYNAVVNNSDSSADVYCKAEYDCGGIAGYMERTYVENTHATGNVYGDTSVTDYVGGFIGYHNSVSFKNCYATGNVTGRNDVGGFAGVFEGGDGQYLYSTGKVVGVAESIGGFVGALTGGAVINNSYATSDVEGVDFVGGFAGWMELDSIIENSYSAGSVSGSSDVGGFVGANDTGDAINSFWDTETSSQETSVLGTGKTTAQMQTQSTFTDAGWDFVTVWQMSDTYPDLISNSNTNLYVEEVIVEEQPSNLIQGSGTIYEVMDSTGAGLGKFFDYMKVALPILMLGLAIVGIVVVIALGLSSVIKSFLAKK